MKMAQPDTLTARMNPNIAASRPHSRAVAAACSPLITETALPPRTVRWPERSAGSRCTVQTIARRRGRSCARNARTASGSAAFEVTFGLQVRLPQGGQRVGVRGVPELAVGGLEQAFGDAVQRPGVGSLEELAHLLVADVGLGELLIHPVLHHA